MMRMFTAVAVVCIAMAGPVSAQTTGAPLLNRHYWQHCWALQFGVSGAALQRFDGLGFSLRRHFGQGSALRLGLTLGPFEFSESKMRHFSQERTEEGNQQAANLDLEYLGYLGPSSNVTPFLSLGAGTGASRFEIENRLYSRSWNVSLSAGFGVEWFVYHRIAVSGEYVALMRYTDAFQDYYSGGTLRQRESIHALQFGHSKVRMGVAVSL